MEAVKIEMLTQKQEVQMIKDERSGYAETVTLRQAAALRDELLCLQAQVTAFATSVCAGPSETMGGEEQATAGAHRATGDAIARACRATSDDATHKAGPGGGDDAKHGAGHLVEGNSMGLGGDVTASGVVGDRGAARDRERGAQPVAQRPRGIHGGACEVHMSIAGPVVWASEGEVERVHRSFEI